MNNNLHELMSLQVVAKIAEFKGLRISKSN